VPSRRHDLLARAVPKLRKSRELDDPARERARVERWHATLPSALDRPLPTTLVPRFARRFSSVTEELDGYAVHTIAPRHTPVTRTLLWVHGGGFTAPMDPLHVRFVCRLARRLGVRVVLPDYPLAPEHTWRDSFDSMLSLAARLAGDADPLLIAGDSAGGGYALALTLAMRDAGGPTADRVLLLSPWVDLSTSTPETPEFAARDPWLFLGKIRLYAEWWAGSADELTRPEVSPALADVHGLPRTLMLCGTRDALAPGCRLLHRRAEEAGWDLTYLEEPDLIHVYPLMPAIPEAARAWKQIVSFLR
jgi:acetyl esterase/lipase